MKVVSLAKSKKKGTRKTPIQSTYVIENFGLEGDAHAGDWHRQVSLLNAVSIQKARDDGLDVNFGDFAENIAIDEMDGALYQVGTQVRIGSSVIIEITQIGKTCHKKCAIYYMAGDCIMPKEGIFAKVIQGGEIKVGDSVLIEKVK